MNRLGSKNDYRVDSLRCFLYNGGFWTSALQADTRVVEGHLLCSEMDTLLQV